MKQKVEILKALVRGAKILILDEPTAVLTTQETTELFKELKHLKEQGYTIVFISHKLNEVKQISDKITVISSGETKGTYNCEDISIDQLTELIIGRKLDSTFDSKKDEVEHRPLLTVKDLQEILKIGATKSYAIMRKRDFPSIKVGEQYRIMENQLYKYLMNCR